MFGKVLSNAVLGIDAYTVEVEAHLENTTPVPHFSHLVCLKAPSRKAKNG